MKIVNKKIILKYMIRGFLWGLIFPIIATIYEINANNLEFSKENLLIINDNKLLTFIYLTPFFISLISYHAARAFIKMTELNLSLAENSKALLDSKNKLEKTYELLEKKNEDLYHSNIYDKLTGLKKEEGLLNDLNMETDESIILCIINLSYFREINTLFGYQVGDELLKSFAERLKENEYTSYRLHGDEFAIVHYDEADSLEIDVFINYIFNLICDEVFLIDENRIYLTINVGVATSNKNNEISKKQLFENAYFALKYAKERKIQYALYHENLISNAENLYSYYWKEKILLAIQNKSVIAFYQPIINNTTLYPEKYEMLIRLKDSDDKYISPYNFMLSSRKYGLYNHLTKIMIIEVFNKIIETDYEISINISISDICNISTMKLLINKLNHFPKDKTSKIVFEILESEGIESYNEIKEFISTVKKYGCKIAIDDFGSGYSNLNHIINLDIDYIKIDASIIKNIDKDENSVHIVMLLVEFSKKLGIKTIAEFVSSKEIYEKVKKLGIDYSQGYYFSEPQKEIETFCLIKDTDMF